MTDNDPLAEQPFSYQTTKTGLIRIEYLGAQVKTLSGKAAERFLSTISDADAHTAQLAMAKATGNFKRGNEKQGKLRRS